MLPLPGADLLIHEVDNLKAGLLTAKSMSESLSNRGSQIVGSSSYIGDWYVQNRSVCKDRFGQSSEMVTYTKDRTLGPEISCKIVRARPHGTGTELDLLCNGEGELGIRQKNQFRSSTDSCAFLI
jgi:hypothetical protein